MAQIPYRYRLIILAIVDVIVLALVTVYGFATHGTLQTAGQRLPATLLPVIIGWFLVAPFLGAYNLGHMQHWSQLWRPTYAMVLAAPLAAVLRGLALTLPIIPIFVVVLGGISALAILAWRAVYKLLFLRAREVHG